MVPYKYGHSNCLRCTELKCLAGINLEADAKILQFYRKLSYEGQRGQIFNKGDLLVTNAMGNCVAVTDTT